MHRIFDKGQSRERIQKGKITFETKRYFYKPVVREGGDVKHDIIKIDYLKDKE